MRGYLYLIYLIRKPATTDEGTGRPGSGRRTFNRKNASSETTGRVH